MKADYVYNLVDRKQNIPLDVRKFSEDYEGWIWGGGADYLIGLRRSMRDVDIWKIVIPSDELWEEAKKKIPSNAIEREGGLVFCIEEGSKVEIRRTDLSWFFSQKRFRGKPQPAVNLNYNSVQLNLSLGKEY